MDRVMLFVKDLGEMTAFYRDVVGFRPIERTRTGDWVEFDAGGTPFALHAIPDEVASNCRSSSPPVARESQPCKLILIADDLAEEETRLAAAGVIILRRPWGSWDAVDPEGNVFGVRAAAS